MINATCNYLTSVNTVCGGSFPLETFGEKALFVLFFSYMIVVVTAYTS